MENAGYFIHNKKISISKSLGQVCQKLISNLKLYEFSDYNNTLHNVGYYSEYVQVIRNVTTAPSSKKTHSYIPSFVQKWNDVFPINCM